MAEAISRWDTAAVSQQQAFSYWQDAVVSAYLPLETKPRSPAGFSGRIEMGQGLNLAISRVRSHPSEVHRTSFGISKASNDAFFVNLILSGTPGVSQRGAAESLGIGDMMVVDTNQPFLLDFPEGVDIICVTIEGARLRSVLARHRVPAIAIKTPTPVKALTGRYIAALAADLASIGQLDELAHEQLMALLLRSIAPADLSPGASRRQADLLVQIKRFIRNDIADPGLGAKRICSALGLSRSVLFDAFAMESRTMAGFIRRERLAMSKELLMIQHIPIDSVAHEVGFRDHSTFTRAFKRDFGITPTSFRKRSAAD